MSDPIQDRVDSALKAAYRDGPEFMELRQADRKGLRRTGRVGMDHGSLVLDTGMNHELRG
jgi:hypothetical protein